MNITRLSSMTSGEEARLAVETLMQAVPGAQIVAIVSVSKESLLGLDVEPLVQRDFNDAYLSIRQRVEDQLQGPDLAGHFSCVLAGVEWGVLVEVLVLQDGAVLGALIIARQGRTWSKRERSLATTFGKLLSHVVSMATREVALMRQRRLDELVAEVAERLMSTSQANQKEIVNWTAQVLAEFLGADVAFLRRNDHARGLSVLVAEWPQRENIPDPDPLGEVAFDVDPVFMATKDLRTPYVTLGEDANDEYMERVEEASGVTVGVGAAVPLLLGDSTWGVLGFIHFGLHAWASEEINALQAVASMLVHLQARLDAEERIIYNAMHDDLTGLPNRRALIQELRNRLQAKRKTAVMVIDLDRFKVMNDYLGHASGDRLLITIADRLRTSIRADDFAARLGGDEFVFLVDKASSEMDVLSSAYRMLEVIAQPVDIAGQKVNHTASIGIAMAQPGLSNSMDLLGRADVAMYAAKARGRNQAVVFDGELSHVVDERSRMELTLREAIDNNELRLHFQPEVELHTGRLLALEVLVRWEHPTRGLLAAADFITVAEETGLVTNIGRWVFAEACRQLGKWIRDYPSLDFIVRVNMSPVDFKMGDLMEFVEQTLHANNVPGNRLCIEITEHAVLHDPERTARILEGFQKLGIEVAIDDFGTGFASMTELKNLPVNLLKLDMSFVKGITTDLYDCAIVESIIRLGNALHLTVVAEGIESAPIIDKLLELGCFRGQGYFIARPMSGDDLAPLLRSGAVPLSLIRSPRLVDINRADER
jgi:diguanylate cyclase (GGDEF)-like protein